jgi:hypothetical protein
MRKPTKPQQPQKPLKIINKQYPTIQEFVDEEFTISLAELNKLVPKNISHDDVIIKTSTSMDYDPYENTSSTYFEVLLPSTQENPRYNKEFLKYQKNMEMYNKKMEVYEKKQEEYLAHIENEKKKKEDTIKQICKDLGIEFNKKMLYANSHKTDDLMHLINWIKKQGKNHE